MALSGYLTFYASTWEEFHTGTLFLDFISGPVEGAWAVVLASLLSSIFGPQIWIKSFNLFSSSITLNSIVPFAFIFGSISSIATSIRHVQKIGKVPIFKEILLPSIYFLTCFILVPLSQSNNQSNDLSCWFIFVTGFPACLRISSTILAYITKSNLQSNSFYSIEFIPLLLIIFKFLLTNNLWISFFKASLILSASVYLHTMFLIISDISSYLNISCLTIKK